MSVWSQHTYLALHLGHSALSSSDACNPLKAYFLDQLQAGHAGALQTSDNGQLQKDRRWDASHYGNLEQFIYDYLTGGASAGESVRLKLQTPLFVAEALAQAAHRQLTDELETATQVQSTGPHRPSHPSSLGQKPPPTSFVPRPAASFPLMGCCLALLGFCLADML